jgi:hypothetical protein
LIRTRRVFFSFVSGFFHLLGTFLQRIIERRTQRPRLSKHVSKVETQCLGAPGFHQVSHHRLLPHPEPWTLDWTVSRLHPRRYFPGRHASHQWNSRLLQPSWHSASALRSRRYPVVRGTKGSWYSRTEPVQQTKALTYKRQKEL